MRETVKAELGSESREPRNRAQISGSRRATPPEPRFQFLDS